MKLIKVYPLVYLILIITMFGYLFPLKGGAQARNDWILKAESVQGNVRVLRKGEKQWIPVKMNDIFFRGDTLNVTERSRLTLCPRNGSSLKLGQNTTITINDANEFDIDQAEPSLCIKLLKGLVHFFDQDPWKININTPSINAVTDSTEFFIMVEQDRTFISVFKGQVSVTNEIGGLILTSGQSAIAQTGLAPELRVLIRPRDAIQWALYYPPILDYHPEDFQSDTETDWQAMIRRSIKSYWEGDLAKAFSSIKGIPETIRDIRFFNYRAGLLLRVGRVDEAIVDIEKTLKLDPVNSHALALRSIIALAKNNKEKAFNLAKESVQNDPESSTGKIALSYAYQAHFELQNALSCLKESVKLEPTNALAWARLAELWLMVGDLDKAFEAAKKATDINPYLERTQTVMGFAYLAQIKIENAKKAFKKAISLDQAAPLPRLGMGLAKIREGELKEGRREIGIAVNLSPDESLIRSYFGKAYLEENQNRLAMEQLDMAKMLDPLDPTPFFYDAIRKQTFNRPVEALQDLEKSIKLNRNRAIYRSKLLLDEDLAVRSVSLARIYSDIGFHRLALVEGWKSLNADPGNHSAHRFLADLYSSQPRHEIARVSELLQSQLLQPINITPVQPQLGESDLYIVEQAGSSYLSFNEFSQLFHRNRFTFQANNITGQNNSFGDELLHSAVYGRMSYSLGQFHYETDGFRENNDLERNIYNAFIQGSLSYKSSIQAELRYTEKKGGDLPQRFDKKFFSPYFRQKEQIDSLRLGFHHAFNFHSNLIVSLSYQAADFDTFIYSGNSLKTDDDGYMTEIQHLLNKERLHLTIGGGYFDADRKDLITQTPFPPNPPITTITLRESGIHHTNLYIYSNINYPTNFTFTIGGSADFFKGNLLDRDQFNPKLGLTWSLSSSTTLRASGFRTLKRTLISNQTIEPTQVAGFNQFFDDPEGTQSWCYGIGIDQKIYGATYGGVEFSFREMEVPFAMPTTTEIGHVDWDEQFVRTYIYWAPRSWLALSSEYYYEWFERGPENTGEEYILKTRTHRFPFGINLFHRVGLSARLKATYIDQEGEFINYFGMYGPGNDRFWIIDASLSYRLPKRQGFFIIEGKNLFDRRFNYQDMDLANSIIYPERFILARFTITF